MVECGLSNLGACLPEKFFEYFYTIVNAPLQYLLDLIKSLLTEPVDVSLYSYFWVIVVYILSMFYGLLIVYVGFNFMFSGHNVIKRENAKAWFRNVIIMIVLVQASFFLYELILELGSALTSAVMTLIDQNFFLLSGETFVNFGLELTFTMSYLITLLITLLLLVIRYMFVGIGVVFFPIGIFLIFIPPLKSYGKFILNLIGIFIFMTFFQTIILLAASKLIEVPFFINVKILIMICAFMMVNFSVWIMLKFARTKSTGDLGISKSLKTIASLLVKLG